LDFSKAVVIEKKEYIDTGAKPYIRPEEHKFLLGKEYDVTQGMLAYIKRYVKAKANPNSHSKKLLAKYSTLQYFEKYIIPKREEA
jgi:hypothetical protein